MQKRSNFTPAADRAAMLKACEAEMRDASLRMDLAGAMEAGAEFAGLTIRFFWEDVARGVDAGSTGHAR